VEEEDGIDVGSGVEVVGSTADANVAMPTNAAAMKPSITERFAVRRFIICSGRVVEISISDGE
jgi:hypothetical protein